MQCRFNGHCREFYSVAEHSMRVADMVPTEHKAWGLLHDASEAYLSDMPSPIKRAMPAYMRAEEMAMRAIAERLNLPWPMPEVVAHADLVMLATEARDLMGEAPDSWNLGVYPSPYTLHPWLFSSCRVERVFMDYAEDLGLAAA